MSEALWPPAQIDRDHRSAVLPSRHSGRDLPRAEQGRLCRSRHAGDAAARADRAAARSRGDPVADPDRPGCDFGLDLSSGVERLELEGLAARLRIRCRRRLAVRALFLQCGDRADRRHDRANIRPLCVARRAAARLSGASAGQAAAAACRHGRVLGRDVRLHLDADPGRRAAVSYSHPAAALGKADPGRHHGHFLHHRELDEDHSLFRARPVLAPQYGHVGAAAAACGRHQFSRRLAGADTPTDRFYRIAYI